MTQLPYAINIFLLVPATVSLLLRDNRAGVIAFAGRIPDVPALRLLAGSVAAGFALCSALGLFVPRIFTPLLMVEFACAVVYLLAYLIPLAARHGFGALPQGVTLGTVTVAVAWPWFIWNAI